MKALVKEIDIIAPKERVYQALTSADLIISWSGEEAEIELKPGGEFTLWNGSVTGVFVEISPERIVQTWKADTWEKESKVVFTLKERDGITHLTVLHNGIPDGVFNTVSLGWEENYLSPMKDLVEEMEEENAWVN